MEMETRIFRLLGQRKVLFHQLIIPAAQYQLLSIRRLPLEFTQPTASHQQVIFQRPPSADQATLKPVLMPVHQANRPMTFIPSKTLFQRPIQQTTEIPRPVTSLKLPRPQLQIQTAHQHLLLTIIKFHHQIHLSPIAQTFIILTPSVPIPFPVITHTLILTIIIISIMISPMTKIHIFQAFTHTMHRPCTTDITHNHHHHTLIIMVREVCTRLEDIQTPTLIWDMEAIGKMATKLPTTRPMFP